MKEMSPIVQKALSFATTAHHGQERKYQKGMPYIVHPIRVAEMVAMFTVDDNMIAAAYLHDTIEDTYVTYEFLIAEFNRDVADLVRELTDEYSKEGYPDYNRTRRKQLEARRLSKISLRAKMIKVHDMIDNMSDVSMLDPGFARTYLPEMAMKLMAMMGADIYVEGPILDDE